MIARCSILLAAALTPPDRELLVRQSRQALTADLRNNAPLLFLFTAILLTALVAAVWLYVKRHPRRSKLHRTRRARAHPEPRPLVTRAALRRLFRMRRRRRRQERSPAVTLAKTGGLPARR